MGRKSDWLYQLLLDRARTTWTEILDFAKQQQVPRPEYLVATEHSDWDRQYNMTYGEPTRIWASIDNFDSLCDPSLLKREGPPIDVKQPLFKISTFSWHFLPDRSQVLICRHIGPLYGNGGWWDVIGQGRHGELRAAERPSWQA